MTMIIYIDILQASTGTRENDKDIMPTE